MLKYFGFNNEMRIDGSPSPTDEADDSINLKAGIKYFGACAYSAQTDHPFRSIVTTHSAPNCPLNRSEATPVFLFPRVA